MKETYEYCIEDQENTKFNIKCRVTYDTENDYYGDYYFYDGKEWLKDFIDLYSISPEKEDERKNFEDFITRVHDYMVHGNIWNEIKEMDDNDALKKDSYKLLIKSTKI